MAISIVTDSKTRQPKLRLVLPDDIHDGPVSVVAGEEIRFRYLGSGDRWFDDPDAERIEADGGVVHV